MADPNARDTKLIQYLNEAYGKEKELETALQAHIAMTTKAPYKKRLQQHLKETKGHAREVERRIKQLGGKAEAGPIHTPDVVAEAASGLTAVASKAVAAAQAPLHALRGTGEAEKMLKNARTEYHNEFAEIGFYKGIESFADQVGDKDTARIARTIRREEERMAKFLERQIEQLAKAVAREEVPAAERNGGTRRSSSRRRKSSSSSSSNGGSTSAASRSRASSSRSRSSGSSSSRKTASTRASGSRSGSSSSSRKTASTRASGSRSGSSRKTASTRASGSRSGSSRKTASTRAGGSRSNGSSRSGSSRSSGGRSRTAARSRSK
jgi:ferritin-like metal-binding protein YciE